MKNIFFVASALFIYLAISCTQTNSTGDNAQDEKQSKIKFEETTHDFGDIAYDGDGSCEFKFKNTGSVPLVLNNVSSSCGCTVPEWPREPIDPGDESVIKVKYNTKRPGKFQKSITIYSNTSTSPIRLIIKGVVAPRPIEETSN